MTDAIVDYIISIRNDSLYTPETSMEEYQDKFKRYLTDPVALAHTIRDPVPSDLGSKLDGWLCARLGRGTHRSWRTVMGTKHGRARARPAQCYVLATDSKEEIKKKLIEIGNMFDAMLKLGSLYNVAHMAENHQMKRLPNGNVLLICWITLYTPAAECSSSCSLSDDEYDPSSSGSDDDDSSIDDDSQQD